MYLVNAPPLAPFPTQWTQFGPKATHKVPAPLVHAEQIHKAPNLLAIIDGQPSNESSGAVRAEYERIMQKNRKGELNSDRGLKSGAALFKGHTREQAACTLPTQLKVDKEESSTELDSDSDDSVDRGIEEAIQEYLKNRSSSDASSTTAATKSSSLSDSNTDQLKAASSNAHARKSPVKMVTSTCNTFSAQDRSSCSSPESGGSDDSFEQSIKDEIEQFLNQKKLQNTASDSNTAKKAAQSSVTAKPKPFKVAEKHSPKQGIKGLSDKLPSESIHVQPKCSKQKAENVKSSLIYNKPLSSSVKLTEQKIEAASVRCEELSDSSSDDGIEEAIQLYQLEKSRLEGYVNVEHEAKSTAAFTGTFSHAHQNISSPDPHMNTDYKKRKLPSSSHAASQEALSGLSPAAKRTCYFGEDSNPKCEVAVQATRRAETAAELMCAEAILDISKAILPSQPENTCIVSQERPARPESPCTSDSSVDSEDGIEQEIQTFLAQKAQAESHGMTPVKQSPSSHQRVDQRNQHSPSNNKTALSQKAKFAESKPVQKDLVGKGEKRRVDVVGITSTVSTPPDIRSADVAANKTSKASFKSEEARHIVQKAAESLASLPGITGGKRKVYTKTRSKCSADTSSSLDSDEDLDSAIKDLLRSKRKCKKRPKDCRQQYKKRVRFGETTTRNLESLGTGSDVKDCLLKPAVKSCLLNASNPQENTLKSNVIMKVSEDNKSTVSISDLSAKKSECKPACASDNPLSSSGALPDTQDSSSVDSDDSIEQEIRKFLAERARESAELCAEQKTAPTVTCLTAVTQTNPPASLSTPPPVKQEPRVLSISETETILQKVMEKDRSNAPLPQPAVIQRVQDYKDIKPQVRLIQRPPVEVPKVPAPVHSVIVKRDCFLEKNRVIRPPEKGLQTTPERVIVKTGVNGSQGGSPVAGNFVAGLKYISGADQQLLLNMGKAGSARMATELYSPGGNITRLGACQPVQKKTLILEQPKIVQAPTFSLNNPVVRPALYVVTTKVVKDTPTALCLPINTATYDAGLNLMSIQYCQGQVAANTPMCTTPFPFQQSRGSEILVNIPGKPGEALPLGTKAKESQSVTEIASRSCNKVKSAEDVGAGSGSSSSSGSSAKKENM